MPPAPPWNRAQWEDFASVCAFHGVSAYLHSRVGREAWRDAPPEVRESIALEARAVAVRNMEIAGAIGELAASLRSRDVPWLLLKGPAVAIAAYGDIGRRSFGDLDIFVRAEDAPAAGDALRELGYAASKSPEGHAFGAKAVAKDFECAFGLRDDRRIVVDLHWGLAPRIMGFRAPFETLWKRRDSIALGGNDIAVPGRVDLAWYLAIHGSRHLWYRWTWLCDLALVMAQLAPAEVEELKRLAIRRRNPAYVAAALAVLGDAGLLPGGCVRLRGETCAMANAAGLRIVRRIARESLTTRHIPPSNNTELPLAHALMVESPAARARYLMDAGANAVSKPGLVIGSLKRRFTEGSTR